MIKSFFRSDAGHIALSSPIDGATCQIERMPPELTRDEARELATVLAEWADTGSLAGFPPPESPPAPRVKRNYRRKAKA